MSSLHFPSSSSTRKIYSGSSDVIQKNDGLIIWYSPAASQKNVTVNPGITDGQTVLIKDGQMTADVYSIIISTQGCTIDQSSSFTMDKKGSCIGLVWDGSSNWIVT